MSGWRHNHLIPEEEQRAFNPVILWRLLSYLRPYRARVTLATLAMLLDSAAALAGPYLVSLAIDRHLVPRRLEGLDLLVFLFLIIQAAGWLGSFGQTYLMAWVGQRVISRLREELFSHLQNLTLDFFDRHPAGLLISRVISDVNAIQELITAGVVQVLDDLVTLGGIVGVLVFMNLRLALVSLITLPLLVYTATAFRQRVLRAYRRVRNMIARVNISLQEGISGIRVTQSFVREEFNLERFSRTNQEAMKANLAAASLISLFMPAVELVGAFGTALVLWHGGRQILAGELSVGVLVAFLAYLGRFFQPLRDLSHIYNVMQSAVAASENVFDILDTRPSVVDDPDAPEMDPPAGRVSFRGVTFGYRPGEPVLRGINLEVELGELVALVGPTGAGKTTLASLLCRFYDPWEGVILIDGRDIRRVKVASLRRYLGVVLQDGFLMAGTVKDNIRYGCLEATDEEIREAARAVGADEVIAGLERGYNTGVAERGQNLSAGQRQLICFARAWLRNPRVLILDEATSSVDPVAEGKLRAAMEALLRGRTSFIIDHRLNYVHRADRVVVLEQGRVVGVGKHQELLASGGVYAGLYRRRYGGDP